MPLLQRRQGVPQKSRYQDYKGSLREDFSYQCVYCRTHENDYGGPLHYGVEHFKPKALFPQLEVTYTNLLYSCDSCNTNKSSDWPADDPIATGKGYIDPCVHDYDLHFAYTADFRVQGLTPVGQYMVEHLGLNRENLIMTRTVRSANEAIYKRAIAGINLAITRITAKLAGPGLSSAVKKDLRAERDLLRVQLKLAQDYVSKKPIYTLTGHRRQR